MSIWYYMHLFWKALSQCFECSMFSRFSKKPSSNWRSKCQRGSLQSGIKSSFFLQGWEIWRWEHKRNSSWSKAVNPIKYYHFVVWSFNSFIKRYSIIDYFNGYFTCLEWCRSIWRDFINHFCATRSWCPSKSQGTSWEEWEQIIACWLSYRSNFFQWNFLIVARFSIRCCCLKQFNTSQSGGR